MPHKAKNIEYKKGEQKRSPLLLAKKLLTFTVCKKIAHIY
jgi:hypothetical protein